MAPSDSPSESQAPTSAPSQAPSEQPSQSPSLPGFFLVSAESGTSCFVSDDRQCIYSDADGAGPDPYPEGDCVFGITVIQDSSTIGTFNVTGDDVLRIAGAVPVTADFDSTTEGPLNTGNTLDTTWNWFSDGMDGVPPGTGWTICLNETVDEFMWQPENATIISPGVAEVPDQELVYSHDQSGLLTTYMSGVTLKDNYLIEGMLPLHNGTADDMAIFTSNTTGSENGGPDLVVEYDFGQELRITELVIWYPDGVNRTGSFPNETIEVLDAMGSVLERITPELSGGPANVDIEPTVAIISTTLGRFVRFTLTDCVPACGIAEFAIAAALPVM